MKRSDRNQWVAALLSGDYKQGRGCLYDPASGGYCCLGVLADLRGSLDGRGEYRSNGSLRNSQMLLPVADCRIQLDLQDSLARLNDSLETDFSNIATWIEINVPITRED